MTTTAQNFHSEISKIPPAPGRPSKRFSCEKRFTATQWALNLIPISVHKIMQRWTESELRVLDVIAKDYNYDANHLRASGKYIANKSLISRKQFHNIIKKFEKYKILSVIRQRNAGKKTQEINIYILGQDVAARYSEALLKFKSWKAQQKKKTKTQNKIQKQPQNQTRGKNKSKEKYKTKSSLKNKKKNISFHGETKTREKSITQIFNNIQFSKNKLLTRGEEKTNKDSHQSEDLLRNPSTRGILNQKGTGVVFAETSSAKAPVGSQQVFKYLDHGKSSKACQRGEIRNFSAILDKLAEEVTPKFLKSFCGAVKLLDADLYEKIADFQAFAETDSEKQEGVDISLLPAEQYPRILHIAGIVRGQFFRDLSKNRLISYLERKPGLTILALLETALKSKLTGNIRMPAAYFAGILRQEDPRPDISINYLIFDAEKTKHKPLEGAGQFSSGQRHMLAQAERWLKQLTEDQQQNLFETYARRTRSDRDRISFNFDCPYWKIRAYREEVRS